MTRRTRRTIEIVALVILVLALLGRLPSYSCVRVTGPDGTTVIESSGTGPQSVQVIGPDGSFAKSGAW
jgi:hypothetical protein